jgi:hypothetical protein
MTQALPSRKKTLDPLLEKTPSQETWKEIVEVLTQAWEADADAVSKTWLPTLEEGLARWPPGLREAPRDWVEGVVTGRAPLLASADTFEAVKKLKPAARRQFIDGLVKSAPRSASSVLSYFIRVEDRTMMKQLADFGALAAPGIVAALKEPAATEKRYESLAEIARKLGPAVKEAADAMADLIVKLRARRPSLKTTPLMQKLTEALLACEADKKTLARALTPLLDYADGTLRTLARKELEARGLPAPRSPWEKSTLGWPLIAELQRLGGTFDPTARKPMRMNTPAGEVDVPQPFLDLFSVKFPRGSFQGSAWMFGSDAHSEVTFGFRTPYFLDYEAYEKKPYVEMATDSCGGYYYHLCLLDVPATLDDASTANIPVYRLERGGVWYHPRGPFHTTLQTFLSNLTPYPD